ncbi:IPTL-CTERM sorting domain-containing protein [Brevundimonas sp.]|uniref:IPTL-CTERM sorting domain-containing protein n=1 Tax=Brevundimonas sp. TaxID=1871086 RepID=UPI0040347E23
MGGRKAASAGQVSGFSLFSTAGTPDLPENTEVLMNTLGFASILFVVSAMATAALAAPVTYNVSGTFDASGASGTYSGVFTYDAATDTASAVSITTTPGLANDGITGVPGLTFTEVVDAFDGAILVTPAGAVAGDRILNLNFTPDLADTAPALLIVEDAVCDDECDGLAVTPDSQYRWATTNSLSVAGLVAVPTMTEWAMILFGLALASGAVAVLRRRRATAGF